MKINTMKKLLWITITLSTFAGIFILSSMQNEWPTLDGVNGCIDRDSSDSRKDTIQSAKSTNLALDRAAIIL